MLLSLVMFASFFSGSYICCCLCEQNASEWQKVLQLLLPATDLIQRLVGTLYEAQLTAYQNQPLLNAMLEVIMRAVCA